MTRALPGSQEDNRRVQSPTLCRRPRSPSPLRARGWGRSRSLGARRLSTFSLLTTDQDSKRGQEGGGTDENSDARSASQDRRRQLGMNLAELPPIGTRPESSRSKRSSRQSSTAIPKARIRKHERPDLISVDSPTDSASIPRRCHCRPPSVGSSDQSASNKSGQDPGQGQTSAPIHNPGFLRLRNHTWCATEPSQKLETLVERNGLQKPAVTAAGTNSHKQTGRMRQRFPSTTDSSAPSPQASLGQKTRSMSNLTKISDSIPGKHSVRTARQGTGLRHGGSEQTLNKRRTVASKRNSVGTSYQAYDYEPRRRSARRQQPLSQPGLRYRLECQDSSESDTELTGRIVDWLVGVQQAGTVAPPSPTIPDEAPSQTDTAIHVVYEGD